MTESISGRMNPATGTCGTVPYLHNVTNTVNSGEAGQ
jgi:hypothetical protein